ncbi:protein trichome birefringence-like 11 [Musa acuminata AAA Group]|uniref:protein trichome birefringence-like 11 n=1 Tax=Musa acuminata AAA Group TaxID=214697 RepID=UPI0031DD75A9
MDVAVKKWMKTVEKLVVLACAAFAASSLFLLCSLCFRFWEAVAGGALVGGDRSQGWGVQEVLKGEEARGGGGADGCDLFDGKWVQDESYPLYESKNCAFIDEGFRCAENGRPDRLYTQWRWQPARCNLPRFDAKLMLEKLRNRRLVFAGDSIGRNQWESLLCMLSSAASANDDSVYQVNGQPITKHKGFLIFRFRDYNCTVEYYRAPHLVLRSRPPPDAPSPVKSVLRLDVMDRKSAGWRDADVLVVNTGHWWSHEKTIGSGCYFEEGGKVELQMSVESAYERSMKTFLDWIDKEINTSRTQVVFRTFSPAHSSEGDGKSGGKCHSETVPDFRSSYSLSKSWSHFLNPFTEQRMQNSTRSALKEIDVLNVTEMTAQRTDGHQSLYHVGPLSDARLHKEDCSHWCLPGVPDAWNELLYALFLRRDFKARSLQGRGVSGDHGVGLA